MRRARLAWPASVSRPRRLLSTEPAFEHLEYTLEPARKVLRVTLNRPDLHNAFNEHVIAEITRAFRMASVAAAKGECRVVVFSGHGKSFSAGADLSWMKRMATFSHQQNIDDSLRLYDMVHSLKQCTVPVVARVNGSAVGGGAGLVAAADIAIGLKGSVFGFTEVKLGLIPAVISPFVMERIGRSNCNRLFLTGERFSHQMAREIGLLHETADTVPELDAKVDAVVNQIIESSPAAVGRAKQLIQAVGHMQYSSPATRDFLANQIASIRVSPEGQEGLTAFLEKRPPAWKLQ